MKHKLKGIIVCKKRITTDETDGDLLRCLFT